MLGLPERTELNNGSGKRIPKEKFYSQVNLTGLQERLFIDQIQSIKWTNKISPESMNLSVSDNIAEIEVFEIIIKGNLIDERVLKIIDGIIAHPIIFVVRNQSQECLYMAFKQTDYFGKVSIKQYYSTKWYPNNEFLLNFSGLSTGELYKNIIVQISEGRLKKQAVDIDLYNLVEEDLEYQKALKEIKKFETNIKKTSQPNKKLNLVRMLRDLKNKWGVE